MTYQEFIHCLWIICAGGRHQRTPMTSFGTLRWWLDTLFYISMWNKEEKMIYQLFQNSTNQLYTFRVNKEPQFDVGTTAQPSGWLKISLKGISVVVIGRGKCCSFTYTPIFFLLVQEWEQCHELTTLRSPLPPFSLKRQRICVRDPVVVLSAAPLTECIHNGWHFCTFDVAAWI